MTVQVRVEQQFAAGSEVAVFLRNGLFMGEPDPVGRAKVPADGVFAFADGIEAGRAYVLVGQGNDGEELTISAFGKDGPEIARPKKRAAARRKSAKK